MKRITKILLFAVSLAFGATSHAADLSEEAVNALIDKVEAVATNLDARGLEDLLSDDIEISVTLDVNGEQQTLQLSKPEYIGMLQQTWEIYKNYQYQREILSIEIEGDQALINAEVRESIVVNGQTLTSVSQEEALIELVDGKARITRIVGNTQM